MQDSSVRVCVDAEHLAALRLAWLQPRPSPPPPAHVTVPHLWVGTGANCCFEKSERALKNERKIQNKQERPVASKDEGRLWYEVLISACVCVCVFGYSAFM